VLPGEAVDQLPVAAGPIIMASPKFERLLQAAGAKIVVEPASVGSNLPPPGPLDVPAAASAWK